MSGSFLTSTRSLHCEIFGYRVGRWNSPHLPRNDSDDSKTASLVTPCNGAVAANGMAKYPNLANREAMSPYVDDRLCIIHGRYLPNSRCYLFRSESQQILAAWRTPGLISMTAITKTMWMKPPATWNENPRSHNISKTMATVQSISASVVFGARDVFKPLILRLAKTGDLPH